MKSIKLKISILLLSIFSILFISGCSELKEDEPKEETLFEFQIANKSQYQLNHVYLHSPNQNYKETEPLIDNWLEIDDHISMNLREGDYLVTVTRKKNETGPLLAYTTESPMYLFEDKKLDYFDDYFRLGEIEVPEAPDDETVVVGNDDSIDGCFINGVMKPQ